jgi:hypothetical protein
MVNRRGIDDYRGRARHLWIVIVALLVSSSASSQPTPYQRVQRAPSIASLIPLQEVVFNDGNYALVDNKSSFDKQKQKDVEATCPPGMKAMSAGFAAASGAGEPREYRIILSTPKDNGNGWKIYAAFDLSGNLLAADFDWELRIHLVCAKLS